MNRKEKYTNCVFLAKDNSRKSSSLSMLTNSKINKENFSFLITVRVASIIKMNHMVIKSIIDSFFILEVISAASQKKKSVNSVSKVNKSNP